MSVYNETLDIREEIFAFLSRHESSLSREVKKVDDSIEVRFTTFGNRAGCRAVYDVIQILDDDTKKKVIEMMRSKELSQ
jgi:hypothetical protein